MKKNNCMPILISTHDRQKHSNNSYLNWVRLTKHVPSILKQKNKSGMSTKLNKKTPQKPAYSRAKFLSVFRVRSSSSQSKQVPSNSMLKSHPKFSPILAHFFLAKTGSPTMGLRWQSFSNANEKNKWVWSDQFAVKKLDAKD